MSSRRWALVAALAALASASASVLVDQAPSATDLSLLCHRLHLIPVGSSLHTRALESCAQHPSLPKVVKDPPGSVGWSKDKYKNDFDTQKATTVDAKKNRVPTPDEDAALKALDAKHADLQKLQAEYDANVAKRKQDTNNDAAQAQADMDAQAAQWKVVLDDKIKKAQYDADVAAVAADKVRDALDMKRVDEAKAKLKDFDAQITDAKVKAATDPATVKAFDDKIAQMKIQRDKDNAQKALDDKQAQDDKALADSAEKRQRALDREARAKQREANANEFQDTLNSARIARDDAAKRKDLLANEKAERAKWEKRQKEAEEISLENEKNREAEALDRQKRMDAYKKEETDINQRRKDYDDAEAKRRQREKDREDARLKRQKDADDEDARIKKLKDRDGPPEERSKQDNEEECKDKSVNCGSGRCFQRKDKPEEKRCQCQEGDKGANCEHVACSYDVADGTGKTKKQKGNNVNGECVRWRSVYRCKCNQPWRLDVQCRQKDPVRGGTKEIQVSDEKCKGLRKPENEYAKHICSLCDTGCAVRRQLLSNGTDHSPAMAPTAHRKLMPEDDFTLTCNNRMLANGNVAFAFDDGNQKTPAAPSTSTQRKLAKRPRGNQRPPHVVASGIDTFAKCQDECLKRNGGKTEEKKTLAEGKMDAVTHCTWVWFVASSKKCYLFRTGGFPSDAITPNTNTDGDHPMDGTPPPAESGFVAFVAYPRQFNLYRALDKTPDETIQGYKVVFGKDDTDNEDECTFAYKSSGADKHCAANADTVREMAFEYEKRINAHPKLKPIMITPLPVGWENGFGTSVHQLDVKSQRAKVDWTYKLDALMRVTEVSGTSKVIRSDASGSSSKRPEGEFESIYGELMRRVSLGKQTASFAAGHLIAFQQYPPNFYFNYVPQHPNSNSAYGAWWSTELVAASLIDFGCHLKYVVKLVYEDKLPSEKLAMLPGWSKTRTSKLPVDIPDDNGNGDVDMGRRLARKGDKVERRPYIKDELRCHYRFRPFTMSIDFHLVKALDESGNPKVGKCANLHEAMGEQKFIKVNEDKLETSRVFAYLMVKSDLTSRTPSSTKDLTRVLRVATAMYKEDSKLMDYAEMGNIAKFSSLTFSFDFHKAFLGSVKKNMRCLTFTDKSCDKWTMRSEEQPHGVLEDSNGQCITFDGAKLAKGPLTGMDECAQFKYVHPIRELELASMKPLDLGDSLDNGGDGEDGADAKPGDGGGDNGDAKPGDGDGGADAKPGDGDGDDGADAKPGDGGDGDDTKPSDGDGDDGSGDGGDDEGDDGEDEEPDPKKANTVEDLIVGIIWFPKEETCVKQDYTLTDNMAECWRVSIGYLEYLASAAVPPK